MEQEYKWTSSAEQFAQIRSAAWLMQCCMAQQVLHMQAIYYETADSLLRQNGAALRMRRENDRTVCCMKQGKRVVNGCTVRNEYEVDAKNIMDGLKKLPDAGAPQALCSALCCADLRELARTEFTREAWTLRYSSDGAECVAELAMDSGRLGKSSRTVPFSETELELKSGDAAAFHQLAERVCQAFALERQPLSKLARAIAAGSAEC